MILKKMEFSVRKSVIFSISTLLCALTIGCATSVKTTVQRPAELDMNGAKSISVLPFRATEKRKADTVLSIPGILEIISNQNDTGSDISDIAQNITRVLQSKISDGGYFDIIDSSVVQQKISSGNPAPCDAYLTGTIYGFRDDVLRNEYRRKDSDGNVYWEYAYKRRVIMTVFYEVIDASTSRVISSRSKDFEVESSEYDSEWSLPSAAYVVRNSVEQFAVEVSHQIQPYTEEIYLKLLKDKTKDARMEQANKLAKNGSLESARKLFMQCYEEKHWPEAGYNAAMLYRAQGNLEEARSLMMQVYAESGLSDAAKAMDDINVEIQKQKKLQQQLQGR